MIERMRQLVTDKNSTGSLLLATSRLYSGAEMQTKHQEKFSKRHREI